MMVLIIGGSGSGKSAYAEEYIGRIAGKGNKYYLATMQVFDEEGKKKVSRHQRLRKNKGFLTIEPVSYTHLPHRSSSTMYRRVTEKKLIT